MDYMKAKRLLDKYRINSTECIYVDDSSSAVNFAKSDAIALKVISNKSIHKTKEHLIELNLKGRDEIEKAFTELKTRGRRFSPYKMLAQKMEEPGVEIIMGGTVDEQFGKVVMVGLGGIYVETFKDAALRLCPISRYDAYEMLAQLRSRQIITFNDKATKMLVLLLLKFSHMFEESDRIREIDLNPVIVRQRSYSAVDIRIMV